MVYSFRRYLRSGLRCPTFEPCAAVSRAADIKRRTVQYEIPIRLQRLRPSLVAQCNEGCFCRTTLYEGARGGPRMQGTVLRFSARTSLLAGDGEIVGSNALAECRSIPKASGFQSPAPSILARRSAVSTSYLTRRWNARYCSLRSKKSPTESGDIRPSPACECAGLACGAIYESSLLACLDSKPSLSLTDLVTCLAPTAPQESKAIQVREVRAMSEHRVTIWFDDMYAARKWTAKCTCEWVACCRDEREAKESREIHLTQNTTTRYSEPHEDS